MMKKYRKWSIGSGWFEPDPKSLAVSFYNPRRKENTKINLPKLDHVSCTCFPTPLNALIFSLLSRPSATQKPRSPYLSSNSSLSSNSTSDCKPPAPYHTIFILIHQWFMQCQHSTPDASIFIVHDGSDREPRMVGFDCKFKDAAPELGNLGFN